jgi:hypothetical protein
MQECIGHRPATATPLIDVEVRTAGVVSAVEFVDGCDAHLSSGGLPGVQDLPAHPRPLDGDLATGAVPLVGPAEVVFQPLVDRERLPGAVRATPQPAIVTGGVRPEFVIGSLSAHMNHGVDRRTAADHATPRVVNAAAGQTWVGLGREAPVGAGVGNRVEVAHRDLDPEPVVLATGFYQEHTVLRIGAEPVGEQAARTACSHDDVVEFSGGAHLRHCSSSRRVRVHVCATPEPHAHVPVLGERFPSRSCATRRRGAASGPARS